MDTCRGRTPSGSALCLGLFAVGLIALAFAVPASATALTGGLRSAAFQASAVEPAQFQRSPISPKLRIQNKLEKVPRRLKAGPAPRGTNWQPERKSTQPGPRLPRETRVPRQPRLPSLPPLFIPPDLPVQQAQVLQSLP